MTEIRPPRRTRLVLGIVGVLAVVAGAACVPPPPPPEVVVYGDSLLSAAQPYLSAELVAADGPPHAIRGYGGTAPCDWFSRLDADLAGTPPEVVVLAFSGNNISPCMRDEGLLGGAALLERYARDLHRVLDSAAAAGARVELVRAPISSSGSGWWDAFGDLLADLAAAPGVDLVDGGADIAPDGVWTERRPCLPHETAPMGCADGTIVVRAPDGGHFCPEPGTIVGGVVPPCPVYSSGAWRYARAIALAVRT